MRLNHCHISIIRLLWVLIFYVLSNCILINKAVAKNKPHYLVKATFLYQFMDFTRWPKSNLKTENICILGKNPFGSYLQKIAKEHPRKLPVKLLYLQKVESLVQCQVVFISKSENNRLSKVIETIQNKPILTVSDITGFAVQNGMIEFVIQDSKIKLVINLPSVKRAGLKLSAQLISLATLIEAQEQQRTHND